MPPRKGSGNRRRAQQMARRAALPRMETSNTSPRPNDAPGVAPQPVARPAQVRRPRRPTTSAQARALRLQEAIQAGNIPGLQHWAEVFATPPEERTQRREFPLGAELDAMEWWAREMAKQGMDVYLLPYQPTPSINPPRPRTLAAGYVKASQTLYVRFRNGQVYCYYKVPPNVWRNFRRVKSPGRFINRVLNFYPYAEVRELYQPTGMK